MTCGAMDRVCIRCISICSRASASASGGKAHGPSRASSSGSSPTTSDRSRQMDQEKAKAPAVGMWAIIEIFGHQRIAGWMTEQVIAGQGFIRVDVPEISAEVGGPIATHSKLYGPGSIYAISPV